MKDTNSYKVIGCLFFMDFSVGLNIVYGDKSNRNDVQKAEEFLASIPITVRGGGSTLEMWITGNAVVLDPSTEGVDYEGLGNIDSQKYDVEFGLANAHGD